MISKKICLLFMILIIFSSCSPAEHIPEKVMASEGGSEYEMNMKRDILCLLMAYPEYVTGISREASGNVYLLLKSGKRVLYDDKKKKSSEEKLNNPDVQDMMEQVYPLGRVNKLMDNNFDPGRVRIYPLIMEVYGGSKENVEHNLRNVKIGYKSFSFNKRNGAADALENVMEELVPAAGRYRNINSHVFPVMGTFNYRHISGTGRLSPHAFGIAIDLASSRYDYWRWASRDQGEKRLLSYPVEIVDAFERNGFVWGGKWGHFDILHFEYRPEIILKSRYFSRRPVSGIKWHEGVQEDEQSIKYINLIDGELN